MSRFGTAFNFGGDDSSSEDDGSSQGETPAAGENVPAAQAKVSKYIMDSDDEGEEERHFKLGRDKKWEALEKILDECRKHANISDFNAMDSDLPKLAGEIEKNSSLLFKEQGEKLPCRVLKVLLQFEDTINEVTNAMKKKMNKINASAHNKIKQKFKKYLQGTGEGEWLYEKQLAAFREDPKDSEEEKKESESEEEEEEDEEEEEEEEQDEDDDDEDADVKAAADGAAQEAAKEKGGDDAKEDDEYGDYYDEEDYDAEDDADADGDEDEIDFDSAEINPKLRQKYGFLWKTREEMTASERRWKWVKKESLPADLTKLMEQLKGGKKKDKKMDDDGDDGDEKEKKEKEQKEEYLTQIKRDYLAIDFTLYVNCQEIMEALKAERVKTKYSADYHVQVLTKILETMPSVEPHEIKMKVDVVILLVGTIFQTAKSTTFLSREDWVTVCGHVKSLLQLAQNPEFLKGLKESHAEDQKVTETKDSDEENEKNAEEVLEMLENQNQYEIERSVFPSLSTFLERMDENLWKSYQKLAGRASGIQYLERINDENKLLFLIDETMELLSQFDLDVFKARISLIKLTYLYYKNDAIYEKIRKRMEAKGSEAATQQLQKIYFVTKSEEEIQKICHLVQLHGQPKMRVKATLLQVYHLALHNKVVSARDLLQKTHIGQIISLQHVDNQILYNRAIAQIGMACFRLGMIEQSHEVLVEIFQSPRFRELLAQGVNRHYEKTAEQEVEEKRRLMPAHMSINLQTLESIHYITSMLIEIPMLSENQHSMSRTVVSRQYRKLIEMYDNRQAFVLAAEQSKDHIVFAARALNKSDWQTALKHVYSINAITRMSEFETGSLQTTLDFAFKRAAMLSFLFRASKSYCSFSLTKLASQFALEQKQVKKIVSKLILQNRLQACLDIKKDLLLLDEAGKDVQELQQLSLQYVSQISTMVNQNERIVEILNHQQDLAGKAVKQKAVQAEKQAASQNAAAQ